MMSPPWMVDALKVPHRARIFLYPSTDEAVRVRLGLLKAGPFPFFGGSPLRVMMQMCPPPGDPETAFPPPPFSSNVSSTARARTAGKRGAAG